MTPAQARPVPGRAADDAQVRLPERSGIAAFQDQVVVIAEHRKRRVRRLRKWALHVATRAVGGGKIHVTLRVVATLAARAGLEHQNGQPCLYRLVSDHRSAYARPDHHHVG
jgi:hypothetical protein